MSNILSLLGPSPMKYKLMLPIPTLATYLLYPRISESQHLKSQTLSLLTALPVIPQSCKQ